MRKLVVIVGVFFLGWFGGRLCQNTKSCPSEIGCKCNKESCCKRSPCSCGKECHCGPGLICDDPMCPNAVREFPAKAKDCQDCHRSNNANSKRQLWMDGKCLRGVLLSECRCRPCKCESCDK